MFKSNGVELELTAENMTVMMGRTVPEIGEALLPFIPLPRRQEILDRCCEEENRRLNLYGGCVYPEVTETLCELSKRYPLFIVSNCQDGYIQSFLNYHKTSGFFRDFECIGRTGLAKAGNIKLIIERNRLERAVYVGDTQRDMHSAHDAGIPFIHAAYGFGHVEGADHSICVFSELLPLVDSLFSREEM